jgi:hypothetical protein
MLSGRWIVPMVDAVLISTIIVDIRCVAAAPTEDL